MYKECRREFGKNHELSAATLADFIRVNYHYREFVRGNQCRYGSSIVDKLSSAPKLFHSYVRKRKKGCPSLGPL